MENVYKPGTLVHELKSQMIDAAAADPAAAPATAARPVAPTGSRAKFTHVRATGAGTSRVGAASERGQVLALITAAGTAGVTLADLDAALGKSARGHVQKLIDREHVQTINLPADPPRTNVGSDGLSDQDSAAMDADAKAAFEANQDVKNVD